MLQKCLAIFALASLTGCAFTQVNITPPKDEVSVGLSGGNARRVAVVIPMDDKRDIRHRCGMQKNGYNMDTANVICSREPAQWLPELLASELTKAGFQVEKASEARSPTLQVQGQLLRYFLEPKVGFWTFSPEADIHVKLIARTQAGLVAERNFYVKGIETSMVGVESNVQKASDTAVRGIVKDMVAAIIELNQKYPQ